MMPSLARQCVDRLDGNGNRRAVTYREVALAASSHEGSTARILTVEGYRIAQRDFDHVDVSMSADSPAHAAKHALDRRGTYPDAKMVARIELI
jgi:hypothetical protein